MKTLPSIPKSIPSHIRAEAKSKGLVYVGKGRLRSQGCLFPDGEVSFRYRKSDEDDLLERDTWNGTTPTADYFASPEVAAKYFILPKKTTQVLTSGAKGRFISSKPVPVVKYPDVKNVKHRPLGLAHSIKHCDKVLNGDMEALFHAFTWASAAPAGKLNEDGTKIVAPPKVRFFKHVDGFGAPLLFVALRPDETHYFIYKDCEVVEAKDKYWTKARCEEAVKNWSWIEVFQPEVDAALAPKPKVKTELELTQEALTVANARIAELATECRDLRTKVEKARVVLS